MTPFPQTHQRGVIKRAALQTKPAERKARRELTPHDYPQTALWHTSPTPAPSATPRDGLGNSAARYVKTAAVILRRGRLAPRKGVNVNASAKQNANLNPYEAN